MMTATYPDTRDALYALIDGTTHDGVLVTVYYQLQVDFTDHLPAVLVYTTGGTQGFIDRVDRAGIDVYAPGEQAVRVAESIRASIVGQFHDVPGVGLVDAVACDVTPHDVPYASDRVNLASASYRVTSRPT